MSERTGRTLGMGEKEKTGSRPAVDAPFGHALAALARIRADIVGHSADLAKYTDILPFRDAFPDRFFNVGMAEQNLIAVSAGLAKTGHTAFCTTYGVFATRRAYDFIAIACAFLFPSRYLVMTDVVRLALFTLSLDLILGYAGIVSVHFRFACNKHLRYSMYWFSFVSLNNSEWAKLYYRGQRDKGHSHPQALRALGAKWLKIIFVMWRDHKPYDENYHLANIALQKLRQAA